MGKMSMPKLDKFLAQGVIPTICIVVFSAIWLGISWKLFESEKLQNGIGALARFRNLLGVGNLITSALVIVSAKKLRLPMFWPICSILISCLISPILITSTVRSRHTVESMIEKETYPIHEYTLSYIVFTFVILFGFLLAVWRPKNDEGKR
jgi:hypothetical protein